MKPLKLFDSAVASFKNQVSLATTITVPSDGTDQTSYISTQLAAVSDGVSSTQRQVVVIRNADPVAGSRVDGTVSFINRHNLIVRPPAGEQFFMWSNLTGQEAGYVDGSGESTRVHVQCISSSTYITVQGFKVRGPNSSRSGSFAVYAKTKENEHAFRAINSTVNNILFEDCEFDSIYGDGCSVGTTGAGASDITFRRITGTYCGRHGLNVGTGTNITFQDIDIRGCGRAGLDLEINTSTSLTSDVILQRYTVSCQTYAISQGNGTSPVVSGDQLFGDFLIEDVELLEQGSFTREMLHMAGGGQNLTVRRCTSTVAPSATYAASIGASAAWGGDVLIEDCVFSASGSGSYALHGSSSVVGTLTVRNNDFGAAQTLSDTPGAITSHCGNSWANGTQNDGTC